jgi:histidinol-phosphate aminotransferase
MDVSAATDRTLRPLTDYLVPVASELPSNAAYLKHLTRSGGEGLIRLASNENTEPPSPRVRDALASAYQDANLSPPPVPPLRVALARRHGVEADQVLVTAGSTEVIDATLRTFLRAGDEVVTPDPYWPVCRRRLQALEAKVVAVPLEAGDTSWQYDIDRLIGAITPVTKLVVICTPNNPTGNAMEMSDVRRIAELGVPLLIDAAYTDFDPGVDLMALVHEYERVVVTRTFSKAYCLAGLRVGYAVGSAEVLDYVDRFLVPGSAVSSASLHAALAALQDEDYHEYQVNRIVREVARMVPALRDLGFRTWDSKGNFVSLDGSGYPGGGDGLVDTLLAHGVVVRPFGDIVRISMGTTAENDALLTAMKRLTMVTALGPAPLRHRAERSPR